MFRISVLAIITTAVLLAGCVTASKLGELTVGMTKAEAIAVMGKPRTVSAEKNVEYLAYRLSDSALGSRGLDDYFVRLVGGKVDAFGKTGDFDTTVLPQKRVQVEVIERAQ